MHQDVGCGGEVAKPEGIPAQIRIFFSIVFGIFEWGCSEMIQPDIRSCGIFRVYLACWRVENDLFVPKSINRASGALPPRWEIPDLSERVFLLVMVGQNVGDNPEPRIADKDDLPPVIDVRFRIAEVIESFNKIEVGGSVPLARIADFGLSKNFQLAGLSGMSSTGKTAGTPVFMPPEQIINFKYVKPVSDVFSMGATMYFLLTGVFPFDEAFESPSMRQVSGWKRATDPRWAGTIRNPGGDGGRRAGYRPR